MAFLSDTKIQELELKANNIRESIITMLVTAGSGHTAGPLGMADIFTVLYFHALHHNPQNPAWTERDRVVLSNGHICPVYYATLAHAGYFPVEELLTLRKLGSRLQGHPHREFLPIVETSSGPLGSGLSLTASIMGSPTNVLSTVSCQTGNMMKAIHGKPSCSRDERNCTISSPSLTATISKSTAIPKISCHSNHSPINGVHSIGT